MALQRVAAFGGPDRDAPSEKLARNIPDPVFPILRAQKVAVLTIDQY